MKLARFKIDFLPLLGVIGLLLTVLSFLCVNLGGAPGDRFPDAGRYELFYRLYKNLGYRLRESAPSALPKQRGDLLIYLDRELQPDELERLLAEWVEPGGSLLIAGFDHRDPLSSAMVGISRVKSIRIETETGTDRLLLDSKGELLRHLSAGDGSLLKNSLLSTEQGSLLYRRTHGKGTVFVLVESDLLKNGYLREEKLAVFFNDLLKPYFRKRIYLIHSVPERTGEALTVLALLLKGRMRFITFQALWVMLLFIARQGIRFGKPRPVDPYRKRTLSEHLRAVANFYQKTRCLMIIDQINREFFLFKLAKLMGRRFKSTDPEGLETMRNYLESLLPQLSGDQIRLCFSEDGNQTLSRIQAKERTRELILKTLKSESGS
ncbi:MAG: hypothetical protein GX075_04060 [Firmicutes bacterium]|nr:hypothetical protein [Bacillota bacterium]